MVETAYNANANNKNFMDSVSKEEYLRYLSVNMGCWDRLSDDVHEQKENPKPKGANFYPPDLSVDEFNEWVASLDDDASKFEAKQFFTIIVRSENDGQKSLEFVPYSKAYGEWLEPAAKLLSEVSELVDNKSLAKYLSSRSKAFLSNEYIESDIDWLNIDKKATIDVTIGPYEVYEDELLNQKASFEAFICLTDLDGSAAIQLFADELQELENKLSFKSL